MLSPARVPATPTPPPSPNSVVGLYPGYFAAVMATGIIAIGAQQWKLRWLADALYSITAVVYAVLLVMLVLRVVLHTRRVVTDLTTHAQGFAFLTLVAATNIFGSASALVHEWWSLARVLWWCSLPVLAVLLYVSLIADVLRGEKPPLGRGINGTWFLLTVAIESVVVLGVLLLGNRPSENLAFTIVAAFCLGALLYVIVMTMVFLRWTFQALDPNESDPPAWIAAGAAAITTLAGANLLGVRSESPRIERLAPFIEGIATLAWMTATFWFPLMIAISVWRHVVRRRPLAYHPSYWSLVFPLGMYSAATFKLHSAASIQPLGLVAKIAFAVALVAWIAGLTSFVFSAASRGV